MMRDEPPALGLEANHPVILFAVVGDRVESRAEGRMCVLREPFEQLEAGQVDGGVAISLGPSVTEAAGLARWKDSIGDLVRARARLRRGGLDLRIEEQVAALVER